MVGEEEAMQHALMRTTVTIVRHSPHRMPIVVALAINIALLLIGAGTTAGQVAPTGHLRIAVNVGNPVLAVKDPATGEIRGVTVDLGRALAAKLAVPVAPSVPRRQYLAPAPAENPDG